jgi:hypothetical protein
MRSHLLLISTAAALALGGCIAAAQGAAYVDSQRHAYTGFKKIDVSAGVEVVLTQGAFDVKAESNNSDFSQLVVEVRGDTLHIGRKPMVFGWGGPHYRVNVAAPAYSGVEVSSGASLDGSGLQLADLDVQVSSGAHVELAGSCTGLDVNISSGAHFDGEGLKCETARVDASSGAHADAFATRSANGDASSGAHVTFHGKPASLEKDTSSGGSVSAL